jgi:hypothetical protein
MITCVGEITHLEEKLMRRCIGILVCLLMLSAANAAAATRLIVRSEKGAGALQAVCRLGGCTVVRALDGLLGKLFLVTVPDLLPLNLLQLNLQIRLAGLSIELDVPVSAYERSRGGSIPAGLWDRRPVSYFGSPVWNGYATQPAANLIRVSEAQRQFRVKGSGVVAVIDTGVDRTHPALAGVLVPGYDFVGNTAGVPDEDEGTITQSTAAVLDGGPAFVNQSTAAVLDQPKIPLLSTAQYAGFGHGTMVAGVIHLVAPGVKIMPLRAFGKDGSGYLSDIIRAVYFASEQNANVINMSFSLENPSQELNRALENAQQRGSICVASAGNNGKRILVWPAASEGVMGVASTNYSDQRSSFTNYGSNLVWVAAPGESIITTYPFGSYAAVWGTSFSAPMVSGTVALLLDAGGNPNPKQAAGAVSKARYISPDLGHGRIDVYQAIESWNRTWRY